MRRAGVIPWLHARETAHRSTTFRGVTGLTVDLLFESLEVQGSSTASSVRMTRSHSWSVRPAHSSGGGIDLRFAAAPARVRVQSRVR